MVIMYKMNNKLIKYEYVILRYLIYAFMILHNKSEINY